jgi:hypothetical protein
VASERAFSSAGLTDTKHRNKTILEAFGQIQVLKHAYKNNFLDTKTEANKWNGVEIVEIE